MIARTSHVWRWRCFALALLSSRRGLHRPALARIVVDAAATEAEPAAEAAVAVAVDGANRHRLLEPTPLDQVLVFTVHIPASVFSTLSSAFLVGKACFCHINTRSKRRRTVGQEREEQICTYACTSARNLQARESTPNNEKKGRQAGASLHLIDAEQNMAGRV
jgi:hypothetical protein